MPIDDKIPYTVEDSLDMIKDFQSIAKQYKFKVDALKCFNEIYTIYKSIYGQDSNWEYNKNLVEVVDKTLDCMNYVWENNISYRGHKNDKQKRIY